MKRNIGVKIVAFFALFSIVIGVVGTGILLILEGNSSQNINQEITPEQMAEFQEYMKTQSGITISTGSLNTSTGTQTSSGEVE